MPDRHRDNVFSHENTASPRFASGPSRSEIQLSLNRSLIDRSNPSVTKLVETFSANEIRRPSTGRPRKAVEFQPRRDEGRLAGEYPDLEEQVRNLVEVIDQHAAIPRKSKISAVVLNVRRHIGSKLIPASAVQAGDIGALLVPKRCHLERLHNVEIWKMKRAMLS